MTNIDRAKVAYETFRDGFGKDPLMPDKCPLPPWDDAPIHIREVVLVGYMQGCLDGTDFLQAARACRATLERIVDSRENKNWRKPEIIQEAEHALAKVAGRF
ncbi:hypothetical protein ACVIYH_009050 [Bradyrhizobium diazoefficiens]